jgi:hypothetical protein
VTVPNGHAPAVALALDPAALRPLVEQVVDLALARLEGARAALPEKLAYTEREAARLLSLEPHQLRDARLAGRVEFSRVTGNKVRYSRRDLEAYLAARRNEPAARRNNGIEKNG